MMMLGFFYIKDMFSYPGARTLAAKTRYARSQRKMGSSVNADLDLDVEETREAAKVSLRKKISKVIYF